MARHRELLLLACVLSGCASPDRVEAASPAVLEAGVDPGVPGVADARDAKVIEALLLHILADGKWNFTRTRAAEPTIALDVRVPEKTGMISIGQMQGDLPPDWPFGEELPEALRRRNEKPGAPDTLPASFASLTFDPRIVVADLSETRTLLDLSFVQNFPGARAWVHAWLPGYSSQGTFALLRAWVGPSAHGASVTAWLGQDGDAWVVLWMDVSIYV